MKDIKYLQAGQKPFMELNYNNINYFLRVTQIILCKP